MMALTLSSTPRESDPLCPNDFAVALRVPHVEMHERPPRRNQSTKVRYIIAAGLAALAILAGGVTYFATKQGQSTNALTQSLSSAHGNSSAAATAGAGANGLADGRDELRDSLMKAFGLDPADGADAELHELQQDLKDLQGFTTPDAVEDSPTHGNPSYTHEEGSKKPL
ncbi:hypothetical protein FI667_g7241, partial [Globisporangium splendens]